MMNMEAVRSGGFGAFEEALAATRSRDEAIRLTVGAASMCWEHVDRAGVFREDEANQVADALIRHLAGIASADAIQAAIDRATANPGRTVTLPSGSTMVVTEHGPELSR